MAPETQAIDPRAGTPAAQGDLVDVPALVRAYYTARPDPALAEHQVSFGTSGHRGSALRSSFNEPHLLAITEAIVRHRSCAGITGPLFLAADTHALSEPARATVLEVLAAHGIDVFVDAAGGYTPTPALSLAIVDHNRGRRSGVADGIVITPSHNPPEDGGIKYNPPSGGPAPSTATAWIDADPFGTEVALDQLVDGAQPPYHRTRRGPSRDSDRGSGAWRVDRASPRDPGARGQ